MSTDTPVLLNLREVARRLGVCERSAWTLARRGVLPSVRVGRLIRIAEDDLRDYIGRQRQPEDTGE